MWKFVEGLMKFLLLWYLIFSTVASFASIQNIPDHQKLKIFDSKGNDLKLSLTSYTNSKGVLEVRIDAAGIPKLTSMNPTIGYGRDLNGNNKIDTWFFIVKSGIETVRKEGITTRGIDILGDMIIEKYESGPQLYISTITTTILSFLFFTASEIKDKNRNFYLDWIDLEELSIHLEAEMMETMLTQNQYNHLKELLSFGYKKLSSKMDEFNSKDVYGYVALDVGVWLLGGAIIKWVGKAFATPIKSLTESSLYQWTNENIKKYFNHQKNALDAKLKAIKEKIQPGKSKSNSTAEASTQITTKSWKRHLAISLQAYVLKRKLLATAKNVFIGHKGEWIYIGLSTGIQSVAEGAARFDDIQDPNPLLMAKNLFENSEVQQNIGFMTLDTLLMTAASRKMNTLKTRFMASGLIALTNSALINFVIKRDDNYERIALDTSWESVVGNAQVQADLAAITFFEQLALKKNNPRLKLLGYVFVVVDQAIGYFSYSKASSLFEENTQKQILVPIMVENLDEEYQEKFLN